MLSPQAGQDLLIALQRGVPLVRRPWAAMAQTLGVTEAEVLQAVRDLFARGAARRFGAVFESRRLGYASSLCAVDVPERDLERVAALLQPHPGVTHCYEREGSPNLWFTLTAPADRLAGELRAIEAGMRPYRLFSLPALRRFKVEVVLDAALGDADPPRSETPPETRDEAFAPQLSEREKALVRKLQDNLPLTEEPFAAVARDLGWETDELLNRLVAWKQAGVLRRVGIILRHRVAGFVANGMCVWRVDRDAVDRAGRALADCPEVTHCYERLPASAAFPFNLFAMVHARDRSAAAAVFRRIGERAGLSGGRMLVSVREFKKTSPVFFCEPPPAFGKPGPA